MVVGVQLGQWQLRRADEKSVLQQTIDARTAAPQRDVGSADSLPEWQPVLVSGYWIDGQHVLIDNRVHEGRVGFHVVAPLALDDGRAVLVNRGWIAAGRDRSALPAIAFDGSRVELAGRIRIPQAEPFRLAEDSKAERVRQHLVPAEIEQILGRTLQPWVIEQTSDSADGLVRDWPRPDAGIDRHRGYAVQWFGLAALAGGLSAFFGFRSLKRGNEV